MSKKIVYVKTKDKADAVVFSDGTKKLEIAGLDMTAARLKGESGTDELIKTRVVPHFAEGGAEVEVRDMNDKLIWPKSKEK